MSWKLKIMSFIIAIVTSGLLAVAGCVDPEENPSLNRFNLDAASHDIASVEQIEFLEGQVRQTEYIVMEPTVFNVTLADIHR